MIKDWRLKPWRAADGAGEKSAPALESARRAMIETQIERRGVRDARVLGAMRAVPRHAFVPAELRAQAYEDAPLPIGGGQTISQPYMVAAMSAALKLCGDERVLEVGGGCGYQAAVLAKLAREVVTVECRAELGGRNFKTAEPKWVTRIFMCTAAMERLGLPEMAPFDAILVAAGAPAVPQPLMAQLAEGGRMVIPVGNLENQELTLIECMERSRGIFQTTVLDGCRFVPLVGAHGWKDLPLR